MAEREGTIEIVSRELGRIFQPLEERLQEGNIRALFAEMGLNFPAELLSHSGFTNALGDAVAAAAQLPALISQLKTAIENENISQAVSIAIDIVNATKTLITKFDTIATELENISDALPGMTPSDVTDFALKLAGRLTEYAVVGYLEAYYPILARLLALLGIIDITRVEGDPADASKPNYIRRQFDLNQIGNLFDPGKAFSSEYQWGTAGLQADLLLERLRDLFAAFSLPVAFEPANGIGTQPSLHLFWLDISPRTDLTPPGLEAELSGSLPADFAVSLPFLLDGWSFEIEVNGSLEAGVKIIAKPPADIEIMPPSGTIEGSVRLSFVGAPTDPSKPFQLLGHSDLGALETTGLKVSAGTNFKWDSGAAVAKGDAFFETEINRGRLRVGGSDDGFLSKFLPEGGFQAEFDIVVGVSATDGLYFRGSGALEIKIPVHLELAGVELQAVTIGVGPYKDKLPVTLGVSAKGKLGPLTAVVENVGIKALLEFPRNGGNLGLVDIGFGFKWPTGVGLSLDAQGIKGGGFLEIDRPNHRYAGILQLEFQGTISLTAIGLITTELPGGREGFALLILISAEFQPIQLGMGFTLNGVGGLLGYNRTMVIEVLREGVRDNSLKSILFPEDPVANAMEIISDLRAAFPPYDGQFVIGPMAKIGYGTPTLITLELGLVIEIPDPFRIAILGVLKAVLPEENTALIKIQVNFLGTIDFEAGKLTFDASLFDSRLLAFDLSGDMAVRVFWKEDPQFLLSVGGFHPAFEPPPLDLPKLRRLALQLLKGNNPRLRLETYMAVTSNTVQFGARLELYAAAGPFNAYGFLAFDVLFQFSPFYFIASIGAMLALRMGSSTLASISLSLSLEGTTPWKAKGTAKLKLFWFLTVKVRFSKTWGDRRDTLLEDVAVLNRVVEALQDKSNWQSTLPGQRNLLVSLKEIAPVADKVVVHPCGGLTVSQKIVPLNVRIDKFGNAKPSDFREFSISSHQAGGVPIEAGDITTSRDYFAPAQFFKKSDTEKLSADSFVKYDAGFSLGTSEQFESSHYVKREVEYELSYIDSQREVRFPIFAGILAPVAALFNLFTKNRANARSPLSYATNRKSALAPGAIEVNQEGYAVANIDDLTVADGTVVMASEAEALDLMNWMQEEQPALSGNLQVIPAFEINEGDVA